MFNNRVSSSVAPPPLPSANGNGNANGNGHAVAGSAAAVSGVRPGAASQELKAQVHRRLLETLDLTQARRMPREQLHQECSRRVDHLLSEQRTPLSAPEKQRLLREV